MTQTIKTIDIAPFIEGNEAARHEVARQVDEVCRDIGFLIVEGHGVDQLLVDDAFAAMRAFFDLPLEEKLGIRQPSPSISRGYTQVGGEQLAASLGEAAPADLKEMIDVGPVDVPGGEYYERAEAGEHFHKNLWPDRPAGFREAMEAYYRRMNRLGNDLMSLFAYALDLDENFFVDKLDKNMSALRVICYPEQNEPPLPGQLRGGEHTDYGTLTILTADRAVGGLQARHRNGNWIDIVPEPGTFVVNIADAMQVWTNDQWISTLHRVVNPPADQASKARRHSMAFFHQPNYDAVIDVLPSCTGPDAPPRYEPVTFGDHWMRKWMSTKAA